MKTPDPSSDSPRRTPAPSAEPVPRTRDDWESSGFRPRYVALPPVRSRVHGQRNLIWGVAILCLSAGLLAWALFLVGPESVYKVACSLVTGVVLYVAARSRLLRQRNGGFLASAFVCLFAVGMILAQQGWLVLTRIHLAPIATPEPTAIPVAAPVSKPSVVAKLDKPALFAEAFKPEADAESVESVKIARDFRVEIDGQSYIIRAGDVYPLAGTGKGVVRVAAGDQMVSLPADAVQIQARKPAKTSGKTVAVAPDAGPAVDDPNDQSPAKVTERSQREAIRRYPALGIKGSKENELYIEAVQELKFTGGLDFFKEPTWPLRLAENVAEREGWRRADQEASGPTTANPPKLDDSDAAFLREAPKVPETPLAPSVGSSEPADPTAPNVPSEETVK